MPGMSQKIHPLIDYEISQISGLSDEQRDVYRSYVSHLVEENEAKTLLAQCAIFGFVGAMLEGARVQSQGLAATENMQLTAAENIFRRLDYSGEPVIPAISADIAAKAREYRTDRAFRKATCERLEKAGYARNAVDLEAQRLSLDIAIPVARLSAFAERRQHTALKSLSLTVKLDQRTMKKGAKT
jgi:hypothetical protein